jgi:deoxycytidylate deaminase
MTQESVSTVLEQESSQAPKLVNLDASSVIIGLTGSFGSGSSYVADSIRKIAPQGKYKYYKLSSIIREHLAAVGNSNPSITEMQDKGNQLRKEHGRGYLISEVLKRIDPEWDRVKDYGVIIDGIKNEYEVYSLRQFPFFLLISVQAVKDVRLKRLLTEKKITSEKDFDLIERRDKNESLDYGQQVSKCDYLSDIILLNDKNIPKTAEAKRNEFGRRIYDKYIKLIENVHEGKKPDTTPSSNELCMTIAYALSKASNCQKRKVGAVVVNIEHSPKNGDDTGKKTENPFVISSGYNDVPLGSYHCLYEPGVEMCYRDHLQEEFSENLLCCPKCGTPIEVGEITCNHCQHKHKGFVKICKNPSCRREIDFVLKCKKEDCGQNIFDLYLPGGKDSPGKLLDMCRALHAEETALLTLSRNNHSNGDIVLFSTTQPCVLCSNKIVAAGIKRVVYSEPYPMQGSLDVFSNGKVIADRFEGVKSSAYFKLYWQ